MNASLLAFALLAGTAVAQTWTLTDRGPQCGGNLSGVVATTPAGQSLRLAVSGAQASAVALLAIGAPQTSPVALPGSSCLLFVDPRLTEWTVTDGSGNAAFALRLPQAVPLTFYVQGVTATFPASGRVVTSTDVIAVVGV